MTKKISAAVVVVVGLIAASAWPLAAGAATAEKAEALALHGLVPDAKRELIEVIFGADAKPKPQALFMLGNLEFKENNVTAALQSWRDLVARYPKSEQAVEVADRIKQLSEVVQEVSRSSAENAVAQSYLAHGDFWSAKKSDRFMIDSSWLPKVEMSVAWYDKVLQEFPKSAASRLAHEQKLRTLLGWKDGRDEAEGVKGNYGLYLPQLLAAFAAFEAEHPGAGSLQAFRYQVAQVYWGHKDWANTRLWLQAIIDKAGTGESFYKSLAQQRLQKVEF